MLKLTSAIDVLSSSIWLRGSEDVDVLLAEVICSTNKDVGVKLWFSQVPVKLCMFDFLEKLTSLR